MKDYIETPKISEILAEEFMLPLGISAYNIEHAMREDLEQIKTI